MTMLPRRRFLVSWLPAAIIMFAMSFVWHGVALHDLEELRIPLPLYLVLAGVVYLILAAVLALGIDRAIVHGVIGLRMGFPFKAMGVGALLGFVVYLVVFIMGMSFAKHNAVHVVVDVLWQMLEQGVGGLVVSLGIIFDLHKSHLELEGGK
ncbi:MAG: hypothetical protein KA230_12805 [Flavobacteriales bacterium]|nr:hypothetical protein [Flavobacteriales bacterium]